MFGKIFLRSFYINDSSMEFEFFWEVDREEYKVVREFLDRANFSGYVLELEGVTSVIRKEINYSDLKRFAENEDGVFGVFFTERFRNTGDKNYTIVLKRDNGGVYEEIYREGVLKDSVLVYSGWTDLRSEALSSAQSALGRNMLFFNVYSSLNSELVKNKEDYFYGVLSNYMKRSLKIKNILYDGEKLQVEIFCDLHTDMITVYLDSLEVYNIDTCLVVEPLGVVLDGFREKNPFVYSREIGVSGGGKLDSLYLHANVRIDCLKFYENIESAILTIGRMKGLLRLFIEAKNIGLVTFFVNRNNLEQEQVLYFSYKNELMKCIDVFNLMFPEAVLNSKNIESSLNIYSNGVYFIDGVLDDLESVFRVMSELFITYKFKQRIVRLLLGKAGRSENKYITFGKIEL